MTYKNSLDHNKGVINDSEREVSYFKGKDYYLNSWIVFGNKFSSYTVDNSGIKNCKSNGINDISQFLGNKNSSNKLPTKTAYGVYFENNYFNQDNIDYIRNNVINIYIVYKLYPRSITEDGFIQVNGL